MKRKLTILLAVMMLLALLLSACQKTATAVPLMTDPNEILKKSFETTKTMKSAKVAIDISVSAQGLNMVFTGEGAVKMPDQSYMKMKVMGQEYEMLMLSKDEVYVRTAADKPFTKVDSSQMNQVGTNPDFLSQQVKMLELYENPKLIGVEKLDGVDTYHISFTMDLQKVMNMTGQQLPPEAKDMKGNAEAEAWITTADLYQVKSVIKMDYVFQSVAAKLEMTMTMKDINQPVDLPKP